ncbi:MULTISPECIES: histidine phosphatase family protein [Chryseobacterium]|uniref:Broad specificity phosphatase PhoE n=1 Tax=Chryseobacterium camelliae TaxID=1265445 RepID=A0ABU0TFN9_9FLAO|nr:MULTISPECIES: histidine phosphatase family protein [Chryseobacterium]MDT3406326.1 broad specificity phosphatase PhoE [Pseudacidovorax intermedius]MDQ1095875.1 broad specificity phosphatase PhoE [Chryseobacterium camelliae]MDQ1099812.1 broad specificity phosphatase PhoE [Chryseobacterium sp. SORGH_AS_1048]MDR6087158.1 broad specificity phosphatase PhoE [Chryseobacterium sp. SORGH_AS_0909]MDR6131531.1 broad specificity phosphatase PhoE [Chryseobacterium sp. SORGH_AS_1175]
MKKLQFIPTLLFMMFHTCLFAQSQKAAKPAKDNTVVFYFVRHGKTILNTMDRVQGWADAPLTPEGIKGAKDLAKGLRSEKINFKAAYSSDLGRARQTARLVLDTKGQQDISVHEVPDLRETCFGSYEGGENTKMWTDAALYLHYKSSAELFEALKTKHESIENVMAAFKALETLGIAEDYDQVKSRGQHAILEIAQKEQNNGGGNILVVGHGMSLVIFLSDLDSSGKKTTGGLMANAAVSKVTYKNGRFTVETFGDVSYIQKGEKIAD